MAVTHTYVGSDGDITFDFTNQEINCEDTIDSLEIQELVDACREAEYSFTGVGFPKICNASGKEFLDTTNGVQVGITIVLLDNWVIYSEKASGVFRVLGGNCVQVSGGDPFKENAALTYINILSAASTIVSVSSGSGLSTAEHNKLMALPEATLETDERSKLLGLPDTTLETDEREKLMGLPESGALTTEEHDELFRKKIIVGGKIIV